MSFRGIGFAASASRLRLCGFGFAVSASRLRLRGFGFAASEAKNVKISNGRLHPEDGSDRRETLGKRVSDDLQHFIFRRQKKFWMKFFRKNKKWRNINKQVFSRSYAGLSIIGRSAVRNHCLRCVYFIDTTLGEKVEDLVCVFDLDLEAKRTVTIRAT